MGFKSTSAAFDEDKVMLEAEQAIIDMDPHAPEVDVIGDQGSLGARRIVDRLLAEEKTSSAARAAAE
jgi:vanillate O-demethylase monooxygenase subunit